ncbi:hypothetical protein PUN28_000778 [Cardiocondyla obscurior]|uniref:Uncharacterized protein n=1 Tax=Cardiocondyla obscurior TaxID=286306 RepID=A0AAW2H1D9_9HYME
MKSLHLLFKYVCIISGHGIKYSISPNNINYFIRFTFITLTRGSDLFVRVPGSSFPASSNMNGVLEDSLRGIKIISRFNAKIKQDHDDEDDDEYPNSQFS